MRFVLPSIAMMIFTSIYGVVDGLFVSNFTGKTAFAAINLIMPFLMVLGGFGFMVGTGGSALVAKTMGMGDAEKAKRQFSMLIVATAALGVVLSVLGIVFLRPIARFLGATEQMLPDCVTYGTILLVFNTAFMLQNVFQAFFITAEKPKLGLAVTVAAGLMNIVLDALLVGVFHFGLVGAAVATVISQCVGGVLPVFYFLRKNTSRLRLLRPLWSGRDLLQTCTNGASELMSNISSSIVSMLYNFQLMRFAGEDGVAAYGVLMYVNFIFVAVFVGYSIGSAPIVSFHYGAGGHAEMRNLLKKSLFLNALGGVCMLAAGQALAGPLSRLFVGYDAGLCAMTEHAFRIYTFAFLLSGVNIYASSFFTALNNGAVSALISFLRTLVFQTGSVLLLPLALGLDGVWGAILVAEVMATVISVLFLVTKQKKYHY